MVDQTEIIFSIAVGKGKHQVFNPLGIQKVEDNKRTSSYPPVAIWSTSADQDLETLKKLIHQSIDDAIESYKVHNQAK